MKTAQELYKEETGDNALIYDPSDAGWFESCRYIAWLEAKVEASYNEDAFR